MQSTLDAKAFASITDSVMQLLLLREVLCTSELSTITTPSEALLSSATPNHRASGKHGSLASSGTSPYADAAWMERANIVHGQHNVDKCRRPPCLGSMLDIVDDLKACIALRPAPWPAHVLCLGCIVTE